MLQKDKNTGQTLEAIAEKVFTFSSGFMFSFSKSCFFELLLFINFESFLIYLLLLVTEEYIKKYFMIYSCFDAFLQPNQNAVADVPQVSQSGMRFTKERQQQQFSTFRQRVPPVQPQHDPPVSTIGKPLGPQKHPQRPRRQVGKPQFPQAKVVKGGKGSGDKSEPNGQSQSPSLPQVSQVQYTFRMFLKYIAIIVKVLISHSVSQCRCRKK